LGGNPWDDQASDGVAGGTPVLELFAAWSWILPGKSAINGGFPFGYIYGKVIEDFMWDFSAMFDDSGG
jgi:hypothetical protein